MLTNARWLHRFALLTALCTFLLVIAGGLVTSTDSGLSVPDWPLSYGMLMPPMIGGIFYEHGHRMIATFVGMLTTVLALWLARSKEPGWLKMLGWTALAMVILQGVLGGITVLYLLPTPVSVAHATIAQSFLSVLVCIALFTSEAWKNPLPVEAKPARSTHLFLFGAAGAVFLQLVIGAWMRHSAAGLAIPTFPMTYDGWFPPMSENALAGVNALRLDHDFTAVSLGQIWIHFAHRIGALVAVCSVTAASLHVLRAYPREQRLREPAIVMLLLVCVQFLFGALTVWTGKGVQISTVHVATGALLLAVCVFTAARFFGLFGESRSGAKEVLPSQTVHS